MGNSANKYNASSTAEDVMNGVDMSNKVVICTGGNVGIGFETVRVLANAGARVIMACRDEKKMSDAIEKLKKMNPKANVEGLVMDLADSRSIDAFLEKFKSFKCDLHILINNAGVMATQNRTETKDGLALGLLPIMVKTEGEKRIISLASSIHKYIAPKDMDFENFHFTKPGSYTPFMAYGQSKTANIMFIASLNRKLKQQNLTNFICCSLHPGVIATELTREMPAYQVLLVQGLGYFNHKTVPQGAATTVYCAVTKGDELQSGMYYEDCKIENPSILARDEKMQDWLWDFSEKQTGVVFPEFK